MWTATIESKNLNKGTLQVGVSYTNSSESFSESYQINSLVDLNNRINIRLQQLEDLYNLDIPLGVFTPAVNVPTVPDAKATALSKLAEISRLVDLGVLQKTDKEVADAIQAVKITL